MLHLLAKDISFYFVKSGHAKIENQEIYIYGLEFFFSTLINYKYFDSIDFFRKIPRNYSISDNIYPFKENSWGISCIVTFHMLVDIFHRLLIEYGCYDVLNN